MSRPKFPDVIAGMDAAYLHGHPRDVPVTIRVWTLSGTTAENGYPFTEVRRHG